VLGGVAVVLAAVAGWALWPEPAPPEPPRERLYKDFDACLLTDDRGLQGADAAPIWAGMQEASTASGVRVSYLTVAGPQTKENARAFVGSLAQRNCALVFAAGAVQTAAVAELAATFPTVQFVIVGAGPASVNVTVIEADPVDRVAARVRDLVVAAAPAGDGP
jgi:hypothetical protein